jgi:hypothetical protein
LDVIANGPFWSRQHVLAPFLTETEQAALRRSAKDAAEYFRQTFAADQSPPSTVGDAGAIVRVFNVPHHAFLGIEDEARADKLVRGIVGKRLTYKDLSPSVA